MRKDEVVLKFNKLVRGNLGICEGTETGVDAVYGFVFFQNRIDRLC